MKAGERCVQLGVVIHGRSPCRWLPNGDYRPLSADALS
ncbi:hypothetical protein Rumeso_02573 [Rubellimicrobium mesophilum DSM 19309]|uniref:Uncharacterized protein n=1 Tax=Rubellimicrobium mesophilum DSM 19309 TaxID=442562 RepID=A0A017HN33_9RHOB|nr:hypothetical protein Rumeso_02573 [Rubellimicrobium mesophilum DSM 19309]